MWDATEALGDERSYFLMEEFVAGDVYHVDSIVYEREVLAAIPSRYGRPPFDVSHSGGVFTTRLLDRSSQEAADVLALNRRVLSTLGLVRGVSHSEYIRRQDGRFVFLETSARVGGAHIADLIAAATGVNMWAEWARIEVAGGTAPYAVPAMGTDYAGLIVSLARQETPDLSAYSDPEVVWRLQKPNHAGLIVRSPSLARIDELIQEYTDRFQRDFLATLPAAQSPYD
jgi:biotin carboxylase